MQTLTPEVRQWAREQLAAGHARHELLQALVLQGWESHLARQALDEAPAPATPPRRKPRPAGAGAKTALQHLAVPVLPLDGSPLHIELQDRRVAVLATLKNPAIAVLGGLLSDEECDALIDAARPAMKRSQVIDTATGGSKLDDVRTSNGMFFERGQNDVLQRVEARLARLTGWPLENGEGIQVLQYGPGTEYRPHYDYFDPREPGTPTILQRGGQRVATIVMYLNEPARGGGTWFPDVGLEVGARRGNAVFFSYSIPHPDSRTLHGGSPVLEGEKWIATKWLREREFPVRKPGA